MVPVIVRPAVERDNARCAEIYLISRRTAFYWRDAGTFTLDDFYHAIQDEEVWVAEHDGLVLGFISFQRFENLIHNLFVHPLWQQQGVGARLLDAACALLTGPAQLQCLAANRRARVFYERNGWVREGQDGGDVTPYIIYKK